MRISAYLILLLFYLNEAYSQSNIVWSDVINEAEDVYHVGSYDNSFFQILKKDKNVFIQKFNYSLSEPKEFELKLPASVEEKKMDLRFVLPLKNNLMFLASKGYVKGNGDPLPYLLRKSSQYSQVSWIMNFEGKINNNAIDLFDKKQKINDYKDEIWFESSPDSTYAMSVYANYNSIGNEIEVAIQLTNTLAYENKLSYNFTVERVWVKPKGKLNKINIQDFVIGNNGYAYALIEYGDRPSTNLDKWTNETGLLKVSLFEKKISYLKLSSQLIPKGNTMLKINDDERIICIGNYRKDRGDINYQYILWEIDGKELEISNRSDYSSPEEFNKFYSYGGGMEIAGIRELKPTYFHNRLHVAENSMLHIIEGAEVASSIGKDFRFYDLLIMYHSFSDNTTKFYRIPKRQFTKGDKGLYSGYAIVQTKNDYQIIFNDNPENLQYSTSMKSKNIGNPKKSLTVKMSISKISGELSGKKTIYDNSKNEFTFCPRYTFQSPKHQKIVRRQKGDQIQYGFLSE